nr:MAG TPA: hypothetical protein [Caudoviricetes sp.]
MNLNQFRINNELFILFTIVYRFMDIYSQFIISVFGFSLTISTCLLLILLVFHKKFKKRL